MSSDLFDDDDDASAEFLHLSSQSEAMDDSPLFSNSTLSAIRSPPLQSQSTLSAAETGSQAASEEPFTPSPSTDSASHVPTVHSDSSSVNSSQEATKTALEDAYRAVKDNGRSMRGAATDFGVSYSTLRRRVLRPGDYVEKLPRGYKPLFSIQEEKELVNHVSMFAEYGYGYTISELAELASELGVEKGYIKEPLSRSWVQRFLKRNPELRLDRPRPLDIYRAKAADRDNIARFANFR